MYRPRVEVNLGLDKLTTALVDTGASRSLLHRDVAINLLSCLGRPLILKRIKNDITSLTGNLLETLGSLEIMIDGVGIVEFIVVKCMPHSCIIGYDQLVKFGYVLKPDTLHWGSSEYKVMDCAVPAIQEVGELDVIHKVVHKYSDLFKAGEFLPVAKLPPLSIVTEPGRVVYQKPYRTALHKREIVEKEIDKLLKMKIIRPSCSEWSSGITLVPKKDGSTRLCVDYRRTNSITVKDRYPLPRIDDIFDSLGGSSIFSLLDLRSSYHQVPIAPDSIKKTAFSCHYGQFEYLRMSFGLCNAPAHFQRAMNHLLSKYVGKFVMVYLDDIIIYSKNELEHSKHLELVFQTLQKANITLKESKCNFGKPSLDLLGYVISGEGIRAQPAKTQAIADLLPPCNVSELRSFLGMCSYYRTLVPKYAELAEPLHELTRKHVKWKFGPEQLAAFQALKDALVSSDVMMHPNTQRPYILYVDASNYSIGAILVQEDENGVERPIQYISHQLNSTQRKWACIEREAYALIYALKKLRPYLLGSPCTVYTDHKPLLSFFSGEIANTKCQRWAILLAEYGPTIKYRPGKRNVRADMLSRIRHKEEISVIDADAEWLTPADVKAHLPPYTPLIADNIDRDALIAAQQAEFPEEINDAGLEDSRYCIVDDILYSIAKPEHSQPCYPRLVLPQQWREQVIYRCHKDVGHQSFWKTQARVQEHYVWSGMRKDIKHKLSTCGLCQVHVKLPERVAMGNMPLALCCGSIISCDLVGPLMPSRLSGAIYIMTVIDHYSGFAEAYPLKNKTNESVWEKLRNDYIPRNGSPEVMITDQGSEWKSASFSDWLKGMGIEHRRTTPYHPQSNGRNERFNKTLKGILKKLVNGNRSHWEDQLGPALMAYRISTSTVTGHSPFMLHYARPPRAPLTRLLSEDPSRNFANRLELQAEIMQQAAKATEESRKYNTERLARQANAGEIHPGDSVIVKAHEPVSLTAKWDYGFIVTKISGNVVHVLHPTTGVKQCLHRSKVRVMDPNIAWQEVAPRPRRTRARPRVISREPRIEQVANQPGTLATNENNIPRLRLKRVHPPEEGPLPSKQPKWTAEQILCLEAVGRWYLDCAF